ncbi:MFS general substrate transporter [Camillea tinctor]|nr:MFS general substrate transporter [Camillea tinctor]
MTNRKEVSAESYIHANRNKSSLSSQSSLEATSPHGIDEAQLLNKVDRHVLPILFLVYIVAFLDRVNISNALTLGLPAEIGLEGDQTNIVLTTFFVPYILFEIPSNLLMERFSPHIWLSGCAVCFGLVMVAQGFVQSYSGLLATRFFLGLTEAGMFPGSFYLISFWYKQEEAQKRFTIYWSSTICAGAFGGLLASAIASMDGVLGLSSWRWIFLLEGLATVLVGLLAFFCITDFPREAKWLSKKEREFIMRKTGTNETHAVSVTTKDVLLFFTHLKNWLGAVMYFCVLVPVYCMVYLLPTIIHSLGYPTLQTQLRSVPPFAAAFGFAILAAYMSDRLQIRFPFIALGLSLLTAGLSILISVHGAAHSSAVYAALCLVAMGSIGIGGNLVCWYVMNLRGHVERSIGSAWMICFGNISGIVAPFLFLQKDAPSYRVGFSVCLFMGALSAISCAGYGLITLQAMRDVPKNKITGESHEKSLYL